MRRLVPIVAGVLLGLFAAPVASATTSREIVPFRSTERTCSGERLRVSGELLLISHFTEDSNGGFHVHFTLVPRHVRGVTPSGVSYKVVGGDRLIFNGSGHGTEMFTNTGQFMMISEGGDDNFLFRFTLHVTVNPNGETTSEVDNFSVKCVG
jgi:hypothetical protein